VGVVPWGQSYLKTTAVSTLGMNKCDLKSPFAPWGNFAAKCRRKKLGAVLVDTPHFGSNNSTVAVAGFLLTRLLNLKALRDNDGS